MDTSKEYQDSKGRKCSIWQMVRREPDWAANRLQEGERAIGRVRLLEETIRSMDQCPLKKEVDTLKQQLKTNESFFISNSNR